MYHYLSGYIHNLNNKRLTEAQVDSSTTSVLRRVCWSLTAHYLGKQVFGSVWGTWSSFRVLNPWASVNIVLTLCSLFNHWAKVPLRGQYESLWIHTQFFSWKTRTPHWREVEPTDVGTKNLPCREYRKIADTFTHTNYVVLKIGFSRFNKIKNTYIQDKTIDRAIHTYILLFNCITIIWNRGSVPI